VSPGISRRTAGTISPANQYGQNVLTTVSPAQRSSTPAPTTITFPAPSVSGRHVLESFMTPAALRA
jgi:hypothetical protein